MQIYKPPGASLCVRASVSVTCITCSPVDRRVTRAGASKSSIFPYRGQE
uniref:Uncharacterized protein n=1 Tax=Angiostrongylus cantonensis TaxID=6313 RepID=A0A0K0DL74_ANGCA